MSLQSFANGDRMSGRRGALSAVVLPILALSIIVTLAGAASARWKKIYQNPKSGYAYRSGFFLNEQFGIIGGSSNEGIYITHDGGQTWTNVNLPGSPTANVSQILMLDPQNGFLTLDAGDLNPPILYKTTNGGLVWDPVSIFGSATDVYATPSAIIVTNRKDNAGVPLGTTYISIDNGNSFTTAPVMQGNGVDFVDATHGVMVTYKGHVWQRTTNGGLTWTTLGPDDTTEAWSVYGVRGSGTFFTAAENDQSVFGALPVPHSDVRRSDDYGATWRYVSTMPIRTTGHITGFSNRLFVQTDTSRRSNGTLGGLWRSDDGGKNWQSIGGPSNAEDTRFLVMGCRGEVIIAFDQHGGVWKTDDGGDGSQPQFQFSYPNVRLDSISVCSPADTTVAVTNIGCDTLYISATRSLQSDPSLQFLNVDGTPVTLPIMIVPGSSGRVRIRVSHGAAGAIAARAEIETSRRGVVLEDTVTITGTVSFNDPMKAMAGLAFDSVSICASGDSVITLRNLGCGSIHILNLRLYSGTSFTLSPVSLPDSIISGDAKEYAIHFSPAGLGSMHDSVIVLYEVFGVQRRVSIPVAGIGKRDNAAFELAVDQLPDGLPKQLEFGTLTRCDLPDTLSFLITNPGCTAMNVAPVQVQDSNHRQILLPTKQIWWQTMPVAASIKVGDTLRLKVRIAPTTLGEVKGFVRVTYTIQGAQPKDYYLPYHATIVRGTVALTLDDSQRSFDSIQFCAQKDITIPVRNDGCDTMTVTRRDLVSSDFFIVNAKTTPFALAPHTTHNVTLRYIPGHAGPASGSLYVETDADSAGNRVIPIVGFALPTDTISFTAYTPNQIVSSGDTALVVFRANRSVRNKGLNAVTVTLAYNGDIMSPWDWTARTDIPGASVMALPESRLGKTARQTLNVLGANMSLDSGQAIASLLFHITLSDSARTEFHIESITLNNNTSNFSKCVLGSVIDSGTIDMQFQCGDALLNGYLLKQKDYRLTDAIRIDEKTTTPNPIKAGYNALLPVMVFAEGRYTSTIVSATGQKLAADVLNLRPGSTSIVLKTSSLPSGSYHVVLEDERGRTVSTQFVVER